MTNYFTTLKNCNMIKVKVFEGGYYWVEIGNQTQGSRCDFTYCVYVFCILVYSKIYKGITFYQSKVMFKGCEIFNTDGEPTKY